MSRAIRRPALSPSIRLRRTRDKPVEGRRRVEGCPDFVGTGCVQKKYPIFWVVEYWRFYMTAKSESRFIKILQTDSLTDVALIKSVLDAEDIRYFIQGENMITIRPVDPAYIMVAEGDVKKAVELLKGLKLNYSRILFGIRKK
jgi:hypothetical protein